MGQCNASHPIQTVQHHKTQACTLLELWQVPFGSTPKFHSASGPCMVMPVFEAASVGSYKAIEVLSSPAKLQKAPLQNTWCGDAQ